MSSPPPLTFLDREHTDYRVPESHCPYCEHPVSAQLGSAAAPTPGDVSLCLYCGEVIAFAEDLSMRKATDAELASIDLLELQRARKLLELWRETRATS